MVLLYVGLCVLVACVASLCCFVLVVCGGCLCWVYVVVNSVGCVRARLLCYFSGLAIGVYFLCV